MTLTRRLDALEVFVEQARRREMRELLLTLPEAHDLTPVELEAASDEYIRILEQLQAWKREGLGERQIMRRFADESGATVEVFERECRAMVAGKGLTNGPAC